MRILATLDGSKFGEAIVPLLTRIAALPGAEVTLLGVVHEPSGKRQGVPRKPSTGTTMGGDAIVVNVPQPPYAERKDQAIQARLAEVEDYLRDIAMRLPQGTPVRIEAHIGNAPQRIIIDRARAEHPDVIVMATHGNTGIARTVFGSVAEDVLRSGVAPVLLVHPEEVRQARTAEEA